MKFRVFYLLFSLLICNLLAAVNFDNEYNHCSGGEIKRFKVCGERCSGTNFLVQLLHKNFPSLGQDGTDEFGHKHFLWWFGTPVDEGKLERLKYSPRAVDL